MPCRPRHWDRRGNNGLSRSRSGRSMPVEVHIREDGPASVVEFVGALDTSLPAQARRDIVALIKPGRHLILDMSRLSDVSSTGLRMLLLFIRAAQAVGGTVAGAGVPRALRDIAAAAGFLELFQQAPSVVPCHAKSPSRGAGRYLPDPPPCRLRAAAGFPLPFGATVLARGVNFAGLLQARLCLHPCPVRGPASGSPSRRSRSRSSSVSATCSP